jgi:oxygen-independent coproporphyrinogen-3 oxidase
VPYYVYRQKNARQGLENIGFTKEGHEGIYNIVMMDEVHTVIGIGAGASTRLMGRNRNNIRREYTPKYPFEYKNFDYGTVLSAVEEFYDNEYED